MNSRRHRLLTWSCVASCWGLFGVSGCFEDPTTSLTDDDEEESGDGDSGDGDGDSGDGDGDSGDGDGDSGDGDGDSGDGDGDGDGDSGDGDGDGDGDPECESNETLCEGNCVDTKTDASHCGMCGMACPAFTLCGEAQCKPEKYVFASSTTYQGNFGVPQADMLCDTLASRANLPNGIYKAWVSTLAVSPSQWVFDDAIWRLRGDDDVVVAHSKSQLFSGELAAPINRDEQGNPLSSNWVCNDTVEFPVWSATSEAGNPDGPDCMGWTNSAIPDNGSVGNAGAMDKEWTGTGCTMSCSSFLPIYCFQL
jgi:hypothetical protein